MATYTPNLNLKKPDYADLIDILDINSNMDTIDGLTSKSVTATLTTTGWTGSAPPYQKTITVNGMTSTKNAAIGLAMNATEAQYEAAANCWLSATAQGANTVTITALREKPTISIPIQIIIMG